MLTLRLPGSGDAPRTVEAGQEKFIPIWSFSRPGRKSPLTIRMSKPVIGYVQGKKPTGDDVRIAWGTEERIYLLFSDLDRQQHRDGYALQRCSES